MNIELETKRHDCKYESFHQISLPFYWQNDTINMLYVESR